MQRALASPATVIAIDTNSANRYSAQAERGMVSNVSTSHGAKAPFVTHVRLLNYRSIEACDVRLDPLTLLVGANGAGKSNFLDALRLTTDSLRTSLDHALRERGGLAEVVRKSHGRPDHFGIRLDFNLNDVPGFFQFDVGVRRGGYEIRTEACTWGTRSYVVHRGDVKKRPAEVSPPAAADRLYLVSAAGLPEFRPVFDALSSMGFYNVSPARIRELQPPDQGDLLDREGANLPSVLERLAKSHPRAKQRIEEYLARVVPGIEGIEPSRIQHIETILFRQRVGGAKGPLKFPAINMSDGTLRALAVLTALFQYGENSSAQLVGIEEPEAALHPAAAGLLLDCLREGAVDRQVLVTTHSPDLLDSEHIRPEQLLAVASVGGRTTIGAVDLAGREALRTSLYSAGELLRLNQLEPDPDSISEEAQLPLSFFEAAT